MFLIKPYLLLLGTVTVMCEINKHSADYSQGWPVQTGLSDWCPPSPAPPGSCWMPQPPPASPRSGLLLTKRIQMNLLKLQRVINMNEPFGQKPETTFFLLHGGKRARWPNIRQIHIWKHTRTLTHRHSAEGGRMFLQLTSRFIYASPQFPIRYYEGAFLKI